MSRKYRKNEVHILEEYKKGLAKKVLIKEEYEEEVSDVLSAGKVVYLADGRLVKITSGQYMGDYGISNHWTWREVRKNGTLGPEENGYGPSLSKKHKKEKEKERKAAEERRRRDQELAEYKRLKKVYGKRK